MERMEMSVCERSFEISDMLPVVFDAKINESLKRMRFTLAQMCQCQSL